MQAEMNQPPISEEVVPALTISPEKVCFIIIKSREFDAKERSNRTRSGIESIR